MIAAVRAELLRARSGLSTMVIVALALLLPLVILSGDDALGRVSALGADRAAALLTAPLAWVFVAAMFAGAFSVTREYYYNSMSRSLTQVGFARLFAGKTLAAGAVGGLLALGAAAVWTVGVVGVLIAHGMTPVITPEVVRTVVGVVPASVVGGVLGAGIGWIARNYYVAAAVALAAPTAVELALLGNDAERARYLPGLSLAAVASPESHPELLEVPVAIVVAVGWAVAVTVLAWVVGWRRMA